MAKYIKQCPVCQKQFETNQERKITCSEECGRIRRAKMQRERRFQYNRKVKAAKKQRVSKLAEDAKKAKEAGISYGQWRALQEIKGEMTCTRSLENLTQ